MILKIELYFEPKGTYSVEDLAALKSDLAKKVRRYVAEKWDYPEGDFLTPEAVSRMILRNKVKNQQKLKSKVL